MLTLLPKKNYIAHHRNFELYSSLDIKLTIIHRVLKFDQKPWLKSYIDLNTELKKKSQYDFEIFFYKLKNHSVFGKTMENDRKDKDVKLVTMWEGRYGAKALMVKPNFHNCAIFDENMVLTGFNRLKVHINKPIYTDFTILDLSKMMNYDFYYNYMKHNFRNNVKLLYTDTDSLIYDMTVLNLKNYIRRGIYKFDTSNYPSKNVYNIPLANKKVLGLMKKENYGKIMLEFIGLQSKLYAFKEQGDREEKQKVIIALSWYND